MFYKFVFARNRTCFKSCVRVLVFLVAIWILAAYVVDEGSYTESQQGGGLQRTVDVVLLTMAAGCSLPLLQQFSSAPRYSQAVEQCIPAVVYNRVPKCGSRTLYSVFKKLNVNMLIPDPFEGKTIPEEEWKKVVTDFSRSETPFIYTQHFHYFNFTRHGVSFPYTYINVIRDPVERFASHYYFRQYGSVNGAKAVVQSDLSLDDCIESRPPRDCLGDQLATVLPYFCGHHSYCRTASRVSLSEAKRVVATAYWVVGMSERLDDVVTVLETLMPHLFSRASAVFRKTGDDSHNSTRTSKKPPLKNSTREVLKKHLHLDYDFYKFIAARFHEQYIKVVKLKYTQ